MFSSYVFNFRFYKGDFIMDIYGEFNRMSKGHVADINNCDMLDNETIRSARAFVTMLLSGIAVQERLLLSACIKSY